MTPRIWPVLLWLLCPLYTNAQVSRGSLLGYVLDPSERAVVRAKVEVTDAAQGRRWSVVTDPMGFYRISELPPSNYDVAATAQGFARSEAKSVPITVDAEVRLDFALRIESRGESVTVRASVRALGTESSDRGSTIVREQIEGLPLNRRDFLQLALLAPGVLPPVEDSELSTRGSFAMHANGAREEFNNYLLDGVDNNDQDVNRYVLQPPVDAVQEFKIATNNYSAEYGRDAGAQVNVITRSGGNVHQGFLYEYLRNKAFDARNFFDGSEKPKYIRNQFGAGIGGPIARDRTFYFVNIDALRERQGLSRLAAVPSAAERSGDLSGAQTPVTDPFSQAPFPGGRIPAARISPVARQILNLYPAANLSGSGGNYLGQPLARDASNQANAKLDHRFTDLDQLTLRYSYGSRDLFEPYAEGASDVPGFGDYLRDTGHNAMIHHVHIFSPRTVNSVILGLNRAVRELLAQNYQTDVNRLWGVSWLPTESIDFGYPSLTVAGYSRVGDITSLPISRTATTYQLSDTVSLARGQHGITAGVDLRNYRHNSVQDLLGRGSLSFSGDLTGAGIGDLLLGFPVFGLQSQPFNTQTLRSTSAGAFLQESWRVRRDLSLNAGIRYEFNAPPTDPTDRMSAFNPRTGQLARAGTGSVPRAGFSSDKANLAPRVGFAWTPERNTVLRGGYGIYHEVGMAIVSTSMYFNPPYFTLRVYFPTEASLLTLQDPFPTGGGFVPPASLSSVSPDIRTANLQHWSFDIQHEFGGLGVVSVAYSGSKGTHLIRSRDINQPPPAPEDLSERRPYPDYANIMLSESGGNSSYHSLQAFFQRPMARGLEFLFAYTFSKSIDDTSAFLATKADPNFPQNSRNFRLERGLSSFDMPHRGTAAAVYHAPRRNRLTRGLEASMILAAQTGQPFTPLLQFDNSNTGNTGGSFGSDRPNVNHRLAGAKGTAEKWFDTTAFAIPAPYTFGNAGRNIVRGPGQLTVDMVLNRSFRLAERATLTGGVQAFNMLNRTNFDLPQRYADDPNSFGRIFSAKAPRQMQIFLRLAF